MTIAIVGHASAAATSGSINCSVDGNAADRLILVLVTVRGGFFSPRTASLSNAGFTGPSDMGGHTLFSSVNNQMFWKLSTGDPADDSVTVSFSGSYIWADVHTITFTDATSASVPSPISDPFKPSAGVPHAHTPPSRTPNVSGIGIDFAATGNTPTLSEPDGWTNGWTAGGTPWGPYVSGWAHHPIVNGVSVDMPQWTFSAATASNYGVVWVTGSIDNEWGIDVVAF